MPTVHSVAAPGVMFGPRGKPQAAGYPPFPLQERLRVRESMREYLTTRLQHDVRETLPRFLPLTIKSRPAVWPARLFIGAVIAICGLTVFIGLPPVVMFGHDIFFFLDNCYRVLQGQIPHRDFQSAWGPLIYLIDAVGLKLSGLRPEGLGYATAIFGALVS